jgi:hypothetical protein
MTFKRVDLLNSNDIIDFEPLVVEETKSQLNLSHSRPDVTTTTTPQFNLDDSNDLNVIRKTVIQDKNGYPIDETFEMAENATINGGDSDDMPREFGRIRNVQSYTNILRDDKIVSQKKKPLHQVAIRLSEEQMIYLNNITSKPTTYIRSLVQSDMEANTKPREQYKKDEDLA